jgi:hypothetical protein
MHKFELETVDGMPLGTGELQRPDWPIGSVIYRGGAAPDQRIVEHRDARDGVLPVLIVEKV